MPLFSQLDITISKRIGLDKSSWSCKRVKNWLLSDLFLFEYVWSQKIKGFVLFFLKTKKTEPVPKEQEENQEDNKVLAFLMFPNLEFICIIPFLQTIILTHTSGFCMYTRVSATFIFMLCTLPVEHSKMRTVDLSKYWFDWLVGMNMWTPLREGIMSFCIERPWVLWALRLPSTAVSHMRQYVLVTPCLLTTCSLNADHVWFWA